MLYYNAADGDIESETTVAYTDSPVKQHLEKNIKQISRRYSSYVRCLRISIERQGISVEDLCGYLLSLPAFDSSEGKHEFTLLSEVSDKLEKATSINGIFNILTKNYATFLNYEVFQCMAEEFDVDLDQERMKYPDYLDAYIKMHTLSEFQEINPLLKGVASVESGSKKMVLKFDIEMTCSLAKLKDLTKAVADILNLKVSTLRLLSIEEGCVVATFLIPTPVANFIFSSDRAVPTKEFQDLSILWLKCNGHVYQNDRVQEEVEADISGKLHW
jgi:hypothetical protein